MSVLSGVRVLDFTTTIAGPHCTRLVADLGAEVIKVEPPEGDVLRMAAPQRDGVSSAFGQLNAGKKSVVIDLKTPEGQAAARRLAAEADVLVENFRPGVMARLGFDDDALRPMNSRLIYCAISGYGQTGPSAGLPAYAPVIRAAAGYDLAHLARQTGRTRPDACGVFTADVLAGAYAFGAIAAALHRRNATGEGQMIDLSMFESTLLLLLNDVQHAQLGGSDPLAFEPFATADGFIMIAPVTPRGYAGAAAAAGRREWLEDLAPERRDLGRFQDRLGAWTRTHSSEACLARLRAHGVPCSPYRTVAEALADPQLEHRRALAEVRDERGAFRVVAPPFRFSSDEVAVGAWAPTLGEHSEDLLGAG